jgi:putative transposase
VIPFLSLPADLRRVVYTTNAIECLNREVRKSIKTRGHFPDEQAVQTDLPRAHPRQGQMEEVMRWAAALRALKIHFGDRIPD